VQLITPDSLVHVALDCLSLLGSHAHEDWTRRAGTIEWTCRSTLEHLGLLPYSQQLATQAVDFRPVALATRANVSIAELLWTVEVSMRTLAEIAKSAPSTARGFHPAGFSDAEGFVAMAMDELVIHTFDIALGMGFEFTPDDTVARLLLDRLFPWWPRDTPPWPALLWANGRAALPNFPDLGSTWLWHCAPLSEWDGSVPRWDDRIDQPMITR
jgi:hypothetical protein